MGLTVKLGQINFPGGGTELTEAGAWAEFGKKIIEGAFKFYTSASQKSNQIVGLVKLGGLWQQYSRFNLL